MTDIKTIALLLVTIFCGVGAAQSRPAPESAPRRIALLVGNWDYDMNARYDPKPTGNFAPDLPHPCDDVNLVKAPLAKYGFEIHDFCNVDRKAFSEKVAGFAAQTADLPKGSIVFVYYSGHGLQYNGRAFFVPVLFDIDIAALDGQPPLQRLQAIRSNANEIADLLDNLNSDKNVALVIALDNCRNDPFTPSEVYNNFVSIRTGANALVQYATTPGETAPADGGDTRYAAVLSDELGKGGDLGGAMSRVGIRIWQLYDADKRGSYAETDVGPAFAAMRSVPLGPAQQSPTGPTKTDPGTPGNVGAAYHGHGFGGVGGSWSGSTGGKARTFRNIYDGVSLDIFWCEGPGAKARYDIAASVAQRLADQAHDFGVGRVRIKPLGENKNATGGYNVARNLMRYDVEDSREKPVLMKIAIGFPEQNFLPRRGVGVGGKPTLNYVSAFICGEQGA